VSLSFAVTAGERLADRKQRIGAARREHLGDLRAVTISGGERDDVAGRAYSRPCSKQRWNTSKARVGARPGSLANSTAAISP
jgi:hypothetical protein